MINSTNVEYTTIYDELNSMLASLLQNNVLTLNDIKKLLLIIYNQRMLSNKDQLVESLIDCILANIQEDVILLDNYAPNCAANPVGDVRPLGKHVSKYAYKEFKDKNDLLKSEMFLIVSNRIHNFIKE